MVAMYSPFGEYLGTVAKFGTEIPGFSKGRRQKVDNQLCPNVIYCGCAHVGRCQCCYGHCSCFFAVIVLSVKVLF